MWILLFLRYYACLCGHEELVQYLLASGKTGILLAGYAVGIYLLSNKQ